MPLAAPLIKLTAMSTSAATSGIGLQIRATRRFQTTGLVRATVRIARAGCLIAGITAEIAFDASVGATAFGALTLIAARSLLFVAELAGAAKTRTARGVMVALLARTALRNALPPATDLTLWTGGNAGPRLVIAPLARGAVEAARLGAGSATHRLRADPTACVDARSVDTSLALAAPFDADPAAALLPLRTVGINRAKQYVAVLACGNGFTLTAATLLSTPTGVDTLPSFATLARRTRILAVPIPATRALGGVAGVDALIAWSTFRTFTAGRPAGAADTFLTRSAASGALPILATFARVQADRGATSIRLAFPARLAGIDTGAC